MARGAGVLAAGVLAPLLSLAGGCIDSEPGLALAYREDPSVRVDEDAGLFSIEAHFVVRVGTYALAGRGLQVLRLEVSLAGEPVAGAAPTEYTGPRGAVDPGEEVQGRVLATGRLDAFPRLPQVCDAAEEDVGVALSWLAEVDDSGGSAGAGPLRREMGRVEGVAGQVGCVTR